MKIYIKENNRFVELQGEYEELTRNNLRTYVNKDNGLEYDAYECYTKVDIVEMYRSLQKIITQKNKRRV